jgi:hypothetical protein
MLYILDVGARLSSGGTLLRDAFDPNPPLIFYIARFVHDIAQTWSMPNVSVLRALEYLCILYALLASYFLLPKQHRDLLIITLAFSLLILPAYGFAEREHLMIASVLPYFLMRYQCIENVRIKPFVIISITAFAALGFCLKPYFFLSVMSVEVLTCYWTKNWRWLFRLDMAVLCMIFLLYGLLVALFIPDYYHTMLPYVLRWYATNNSQLFTLKHEAFWGFITLSIFFAWHHKHASRFEIWLFSIGIGFALSFVLQGKAWFYHALPLTTLLMLSSVLFIREHQAHGWILGYIQCVLILLPISIAYYTHLQPKASPHAAMINFMKTMPSQASVFFFTTLMSESVPVAHQASMTLSSRFPFMWMFSGILNRQHAMHGVCDMLCQQSSHQLREWINDDLEHHQPTLIVVDISLHKAYFSKPMDYITFMKKSSRFNRLWAHYHYMTSIDHYAIYGTNRQ